MSDELLNSAQQALANGIAQRVVEALRADTAGTPVRLLQQEMARRVADALHDDQSLKSLAQFNPNHIRGPPLDDEGAAVLSIPEFCRFAKISRSTVYELWEQGIGPKYFKAGAAVRISRRSAIEWLAERELAASTEPTPVSDNAA